jgi:hypothetical protein
VVRREVVRHVVVTRSAVRRVVGKRVVVRYVGVVTSLGAGGRRPPI